ncbi:aldo/keto reductase family protein [Streptomyces sp. NPDC050421]|uniref:aldo/keto reductase family protein n=1 Tax=unclassified Streptomyces TaxID=2593676 RepID=UPI0037A03810
MDYTRLGSSGLKVSRIGYGNSQTHGGQVDDGTAHACVRAALDLGITVFDTADAYARTRAEEVLGAALSGVRREDLVLSTKVYFPTGPGANDRGLSRKHVMEGAEGSLRRLRTEYIDVYQAHRFDHETPLEETLTAFADLVRSGKVLYVGVSEWRAEEVAAAAPLARELRIPLVSNQVQYSLLWRVPEAGVVPVCAEQGMGVIAFSPLYQGVLTGKYRPGAQAPPDSRFGLSGGRPDADVVERVAEAGALAREAGLTTAQLALAWLLGRDLVATALVGASRPEQLAASAGAVDVELPQDLVERVDKVLAPVVVRDPEPIRSPARRP